MFNKEVDVIVQGAGDSIWGESHGRFHVTEIDMHFNKDKGYGNLSAFGANLKWKNYTDTAIPGQLLGAIRKELEEMLGVPVTNFTWSEQGMQPQSPREGWNFDVDTRGVPKAVSPGDPPETPPGAPDAD